MTEIKIIRLSKQVAGRTLFEAPALTATTGERVGIVGRNGAGKSTLAHLISGQDPDFQGQLVVDQPVSYVPQIAPTLDRSGGQAMIARVRQALAQRPAILILDEPSSNLDEQHQDWLAQQLTHYHGLLLLISHDRQLLNAVTTKTWAVTAGEFRSYAGNYAAYQQQLNREQTTQAKQYHEQTKHLHELQQARQARLEKAQRIRKGNRRMTAGERSNSRSLREATAAKMERSAKSMLAKGQREARVAKPVTTSGFKLVATDFPHFTGKTVVKGLDVTLKRAHQTLLQRATFQIDPGDRVAITGPNGCGKTTLLHAVLAQATPGLTLAPAAQVGIFNQDMTSLPPTRTVWQTVRRASQLPDQTLRNVMGALGLAAHFYDQLVGALSGGELVKLQLVCILVGAYNVLMLDEPTNYLDVDALDALADYLTHYPGTVIFVSHDAPFRRAVATRTLQFDRQRLTDPQREAAPTKASPAPDVTLLRFQYDQLMADPQATTAELQRLKRQIDQLTQRD